jgi:hypothetical protein
MLVSMSNAVKIESVPLNFDKFLAVHPRRPSLSTGSDYRAGGALTSVIAELPSFDLRWSSVLRSFVRRGVGTDPRWRTEYYVPGRCRQVAVIASPPAARRVWSHDGRW